MHMLLEVLARIVALDKVANVLGRVSVRMKKGVVSDAGLHEDKEARAKTRGTMSYILIIAFSNVARWQVVGVPHCHSFVPRVEVLHAFLENAPRSVKGRMGHGCDSFYTSV
jgi:hypothetical protein